MSREKAEHIGIVNAEMAYDQRHEYADIEHAFESYADNVRDTLTEQGLSDFWWVAYRAFDTRANELCGLGLTGESKMEQITTLEQAARQAGPSSFAEAVIAGHTVYASMIAGFRNGGRGQVRIQWKIEGKVVSKEKLVKILAQ